MYIVYRTPTRVAASIPISGVRNETKATSLVPIPLIVKGAKPAIIANGNKAKIFTIFTVGSREEVKDR